jgi:hypothetical protein
MTKDEFDAEAKRLRDAVKHANKRLNDHQIALRRLVAENWQAYYELEDNDFIAITDRRGKKYRAKIVGAVIGGYHADIIPIIKVVLLRGNLGEQRELRTWSETWEKEV